MTDLTRSPLAPERFPTLPEVAGVRLAVARAGYKAWDRTDLTLAELAPGTTVAGVLTKSKCPSPEVDWCRKALAGGSARALVVNAGNSNAFTGGRGQAAVQAVLDAARETLGCAETDVFVASTGVIGVPLPVDKARAGLGSAFAKLKAGSTATWEDAAATIMTTDTFPKASVRTAIVDGKTVMAMAGPLSASLLNMEPPGTERGDERGVERAAGDHRRDGERMVGGQGHAGMAADGEGAGMALRLVVDREPILGHDADGAPGAHHVHVGEQRELAHRAFGLGGADADRQAAGIDALLLGIADHHRALVGLAQGDDKLLALEIVEYNPHLDQQFATARAIHDLCQSLLP